MKPCFRYFFIFALLNAGCFATVLHAATIDELQKQIMDRNAAIANLEKEIADYQSQIESTGKEAQTLQSTIRGIDLQQKKLAAQIRLTENRITAVNLRLEELAGDIGVKEERIGDSRNALAQTIRNLDDAEHKTLVETMLSGASLSSIWSTVDNLQRFQGAVDEDLTKTKALKADLEDTRAETEQYRKKLVSLRSDLADQNALLAQNRKQKSALLATTKNKETEYKKILADKIAKKNAFQQELLDFESQLNYAIDPSRLPEAGSGVLKWPLDAVKITQYFGNTDFAQTHAQLYSGKGHNGIDLRATTGTRVLAALDGVVKGMGNTDTVCPGASYGKWVMIEHANGLSTLYGHLSLIKVSEGQSVSTGETIGYSGDTGYATGPHLHFTVYATQGVRIMNRKSSVCGGTYVMPIADLKAYLNPLLYL